MQEGGGCRKKTEGLMRGKKASKKAKKGRQAGISSLGQKLVDSGVSLAGVPMQVCRLQGLRLFGDGRISVFGAWGTIEDGGHSSGL